MHRLVWTLADVVIKLREKREWEREALADKSGLSYATITRLEQGRVMKTDTIREVARAFGLSEAELYALIPVTLNEELREVVRLWSAIKDQSGRDALLLTLRQLAEPIPGAVVHSPALSPPSVKPATAARTHPRRKRA